MDLFKKVSLFGQQDKYQLNRACPVAGGGFSLLETTIAIAILVAAVIGPMALSSKSIRSASTARNTITASNLAQEGIEFVKNIRLGNRLNGQFWTLGLTDCVSANGCFIDPKDLEVRQCSGFCEFLKFDGSLGLYNYDSGQTTEFRRVIRITSITADEIKLRSSVNWTDRFGYHDFTLSTSIFNW